MGKLAESLHGFLTSSRKWPLWKKVFVNCVVAAIAIILTFLAGEIALRIYHRIKYADVRVSSSSIRLDKDSGWVPNPNYTFQGARIDSHGKQYHADVFQENGDYRVFGDTAAVGRKRVLFLGDSFTHAVEVSNDKTFYSIFGRDMGAEVFALGTGGYSTLQEYMILRKHLDEIDPDIVILQFCCNDFVNNHYDLELASVVNNNGLRRPYMSKAGDIFLAIPKKHNLFRDFVIKHSRLLYFILSRLDMLHAGDDSIEDEIRDRGLQVESFKESIEITSRLFKSIRDCLSDEVSLYVFSVDKDEPFYTEMRNIMKRNGIPLIEGITGALIRARREGADISADDCKHLNEEGHRIVAKEMERYFKEIL